MRKISDITSYTDSNGEFTDGDIPSGLRPTPLLSAWFNVIQRELVNVVESAGLELDKTDDEQLWKALVKYFASGKDLNDTISSLGTMAKQNDYDVDINGGAIDGVVIGGSSPSSGRFTTLAASQGISGELSGNASTATKLKSAVLVGGVSFDGSSNINLPGVNQQGNQGTTGNAATATRLQTARRINNVLFDGTSDITINTTDSGAVRNFQYTNEVFHNPGGNEVTWTFRAPSGCQLSGIYVQDTGNRSADNIGGVYYKSAQIYVNGSWRTVSG
ncbi:phage tail protein [Escherichia coli]|nr:phage tail protein [Escherichia coli]EHR9096932.1 phage tail protein [Escherichia coli]EIM2919067.1 phage tail protein [Escherichia coli]EIM2935029.1 phage tail protein [Escherichia coli]EIM2940334.1 phage tail protein [Escherichia coli]